MPASPFEGRTRGVAKLFPSVTGAVRRHVALAAAAYPSRPSLTGDAIVDVTVIPMDARRLRRTARGRRWTHQAVLPADATRLAPNVRQVDGAALPHSGLPPTRVHIWGEQEYALYVTTA